MDSALLQ